MIREYIKIIVRESPLLASYRRLLITFACLAVAVIATGWTVIIQHRSPVPHSFKPNAGHFLELVGVAIFSCGTAAIPYGFLIKWSQAKAEPPPPSLRERLDSLASTMTQASTNLRDVAKRVEVETAKITAEIDQQLAQAEAQLRARQAKFDELVAKSKQYEQTAAMYEEQALAVAKYFRLQVEEVTQSVEQKTRRREWGLATFGAFAIGILAILAAKVLLHS